MLVFHRLCSAKSLNILNPVLFLPAISIFFPTSFITLGFSQTMGTQISLQSMPITEGVTDRRYCESIGATLQKEKRSSVFITATMIAVLKDLTERISECSQPGSTEKSSWLGKKSALGENFWKALEINLTKFVAGDETTEDSSQRGTPKRQVEAQDPRFNRIASDTSLNRMTSLPNLRAQTTTPVYAGMQSDTIRHSGASRYGTVVSERYAPSPRYEQVQEVNESELGISPVAEEPSEPIHGRYSPYLPQAPPAPPAPSEGLSQPRPESAPREAEKPVAEESRKEESEVSPKQQDKKG